MSRRFEKELGHLSLIAATIRDFAVQHNLHIENRSADGGLATRLMFAHPAGGQASIDIIPHPVNQFALESIWWEDDFQARVRRIHRRERRLIDHSPAAAKSALANEFSAIFSMKYGDLRKASEDYSGIWGGYSRKELEAMAPKLPSATIEK